MFRVLRKYKVGNYVKYISFPIKNSNYNTNENRKNDYFVNQKKLDNNLVRAKNKVRDYVLCNDFKYFVTITCNNKLVNRGDITNLRRIITNTIRYLRKKYNITGNYILIPELHKKGGYHLHGLLDSSFSSFVYINHNGYDSLEIFDKIGFTSVDIINDNFKVANYITKYVSKDFICRGLGQHCYFASRGLNKPIFLGDKLYDNNYFDNLFFDIKNDFCYLSYKDSNCEVFL